MSLLITEVNRAPINSPTFTGTPAAPTPSSTDNSTTLSTTAFVTTAVTNAIAGVNPAVAVKCATTVAGDTSTLTYLNGVAGIGASLTGAVNTALTFDGITLTAVLQRVLIKNDTQSPSGAFNGVYYLSQLQTGILPPILVRALDFDASSDINNTGSIPVVSGTLNATTSWVVTSSVTTVGTDPITFTQFSLSPTKVISPTLGGTGIANNAASTIAISGNFDTTLTVSGSTGVTLPTTGTLATRAGAESLTNKKLGSLTTNGPIYTSAGDGTLNSEATLGLARGGTNLDMTATGGTSKFLKQNTLGGAITTTQPATTDLSDYTAPTDYSGTSTIVGFSSFSTKTLSYSVIGAMVFVQYHLVGAGNSTTVHFTVPFNVTIAPPTFQTSYIADNGGAASTTIQGVSDGSIGSNVINIYPSNAEGAWSGGTGTRYVIGSFWYWK